MKIRSFELTSGAQGGLSRIIAPSSAAYAVLLGQGWDVVEALQAIRDARPIANIAYAHDALRWHHDATGAGPNRRRQDRERVARWLRENAIDVATIIRRIRQTEAS